MTVAELKLEIHHQIDSLDEYRLDELYQFLNRLEKSSNVEWDLLTDNQKNGLNQAIDEVKLSGGIPHDCVMANIRQRFPHG